MIGKPVKDSLIVDFVDDFSVQVANKIYFKKISTNINHDVLKLFPQIETGRDNRLVGTWQLIKSIGLQGESKSHEAATMKFVDDGALFYSISFLNNLKGTSRYPVPKFKWETREGTLIVHSDLQETTGYPIPEDISCKYKISGDTLITTWDKVKEYLVRRR